MTLSVRDAVLAGARSAKLFGRLFFPKTVRQNSPPMHDAVDSALDGPEREVAIKMYRGSAKTTKLRVFTARRISYGQSRTVLFVGETLDQAARSVRWLKRQVQYNTVWAQAFNLRPGAVWQSETIEIFHGVDEIPITVIAVGITGQTRGINIDDYRPDLIVVDDPCDEENTKTAEQRNKIKDLFFGSLHKSLAPPTEAPRAKIVLLQTPLAKDDLVDLCFKDPSWRRLEFGCFDSQGNSTWEERFPTTFLRKEKESHIKRNQLALWMREMEVKIISSELAAFRSEWLQKWNVLPPRGLRVIFALDPASADEESAEENDTDFNALVALGKHGENVYLLEYALARGIDPDELVTKFFEMFERWKPVELVTESINFQRILAWYFRQEMKKRRIYVPIHEIKVHKQKKQDRIIQAFTAHGLAPYGRFFVREGMTEFESDFGTWGPTVSMHDDLLDATAIGIRRLLNIGDDFIEGEYSEVVDDQEPDEHDALSSRPVNAGCP